MAGAPKGNTNATKEHRLITNALRRAVVQSPDKLKKACEKVLDDAVAVAELDDSALGPFLGHNT